ncbi:MAG: M50 family peptidase [Gemmatimonadales bacterium]|nr:MAG: M50 family peptidase [Gemmatimonadales bacterium]
MARLSRKRRRLLFLLGFSLYFGTIWLLWETPVVYPVKVFVVFLHEISHAMAALATGGWVERIELSPRLGGACYCPGGNAFVTLSAGYLGSLAWGAVILESAQRSGKKASRVVQGLGAGVLVLTLLFVRGTFGLFFGIVFGTALFLAAPRLSADANRILLTFLGFTSALYAILDIKADVLDRPHLPSDAYMLAQLTGIPTLVWGVLWIGIALVVSAGLFVRAFRNA